MKLLWDENLSPKLPRILAALFPGSTHVRDCGLRGRPDREIWEYARKHQFTLVTKDADFQQRSALYGHPPKLIWLRVGNCTRAQLVALMTMNEARVRAFELEPTQSALILSTR